MEAICSGVTAVLRATTNPTCATCHSLIDPIGFGFEKFDAIGARREKLKIVFRGEGESRKVRKTVEVDLDTTGKVAGIPDSNFSSPKELGAILAGSPFCKECMVKQFFRYVAGHLETPGDRPLLTRVFADFSASGFRNLINCDGSESRISRRRLAGKQSRFTGSDTGWRGECRTLSLSVRGFRGGDFSRGRRSPAPRFASGCLPL
jgi:hypothetical protein